MKSLKDEISEIVDEIEKKLRILKIKVEKEKDTSYETILNQMVILILYSYWEYFFQKFKDYSPKYKKLKDQLNSKVDLKRLKRIYDILGISNKNVENLISEVEEISSIEDEEMHESMKKIVKINLDKFCVIRGSAAHGNFLNSQVEKAHYTKNYVLGYIRLIQKLIYQVSDDFSSL